MALPGVRVPTTEQPRDLALAVRDLARTINILLQQPNNTGEVTLDENAASTTLTLPPGVLSVNSRLLLMPTTANAAAEWGNGTLYVSAKDVSARTVTLTHANNAQTDRTFDYVVTGL